jgi:hypothetical protein
MGDMPKILLAENYGTNGYPFRFLKKENVDLNQFKILNKNAFIKALK